MRRISIIIGIIILFVTGIGGVYLLQQQRINEQEKKNESLAEELDTAEAIDSATDNGEKADPSSYTSENGIAITVTAPASGSTIMSPLTVTGSVPGSWSHEGQFTVRLLGEDGGLLAEQPATLSGDWMTDAMVPFSATLTYEMTDSTAGSLVLVKANPSDLPENSDSLSIPLLF